MTNKEFIERLKNNDLIYETDENGNIIITKSAGEIFETHFKKIEKDLERLENINKVLDNIASKIGLEEKDIYKLEEIILKDLEELEELKKIMGTPIQELMRDLKVLEILKKQVINDSVIYLKREDLIDEEDYELVKEWLEK